MKTIESENFADAYMQVMDLIYNNYEYQSAPRGMKIRECLNVAIQIKNPLSNLFKCESDRSLTMPTGYTKKEIALYLSATDACSQFTKASAFWDSIKNPDGKTINSAYGNLIFNPSLSDGRSQFDWAYDSLVKDKDSRQAFIRFNNTSHQFTGVKDLPCTFIGIFHIRDDKLNFTIEMRSNDIVKGLIHDIPSFTLFQWLMFLKLKSAYPELQLGTYVHIVNSMHLYESDFELTERRLAAELQPNSFPMPTNWRCIKSADVKYLVQTKVLKAFCECPAWQYPENESFYNWILK